MDPLNDPRFPDRPSHPDYWKLMSVVTKNDGNAREGGKGPFEIIDCDENSLMYMMNARIRMVVDHTGGRLGLEHLQAIFLDAFALGAGFSAEGGHTE